MNSSLMLSNWGRYVGKKLMKTRQKFKNVTDTTHWNIVTGDKVKVTQGRQMGESGTVIAVLRKANRIIIEGVNMRKRIVKTKGDGQPGKMVLKPCTVHYSNVMLIDPSNNEPTKISRRYLEDGSKVRVSKKTGQLVPKPEFSRKPRTSVIGSKDTSATSVFEVTFADYEKYLPYIYSNEKLKLLEEDDSEAQLEEDEEKLQIRK